MGKQKQHPSGHGIHPPLNLSAFSGEDIFCEDMDVGAGCVSVIALGCEVRAEGVDVIEESVVESDMEMAVRSGAGVGLFLLHTLGRTFDLFIVYI